METANLTLLEDLTKIIDFQKVTTLALGIFILAFLVRGMNKISDKLKEQFSNRRLLILQIRTIIEFTLYIGGTAFLFFGIFKPSKEIILTVGGSVAVAVGLALKDLVSSLVAGIILLFDQPFQVGDRVQFQDVYGEIRAIGLRTVRLCTLNDDTVTIPNSRFLTDVVSSGNTGELDMLIAVDFFLCIQADLEESCRLLKEVGVTSRFAFIKKPVNVILEEIFKDNKLVIKATLKVYVLDVQYEKALQTDLIIRGERSLGKANIQRPT